MKSNAVPNENFGTVLFDGADVCVRGADHGSPATVITFSPRLAPGQADIWPRLGFVEPALNRSSVSNIVFVARHSHWWQSPEMPGALDAARDALRSHSSTRAVTYGTSMGGYGALAFADRLGVDEVLAISPQFSVDPKVVPEEYRFDDDVARITFIDDNMAAALDGPAQKYVIYDPIGIDRAHLLRMRSKQIVAFPLRFGGHTIPRLLLQTGVLRPLLKRLGTGEVLHAAELHTLCDRAYDQRRTSEVYWAGLVRYFWARKAAHCRLASSLIQSYFQRFGYRNWTLVKLWLIDCLNKNDIDAARQTAHAFITATNRSDTIDALLASIETD